MSDLNNRVILITGASSGIGEATARLLGAAGARLMLGARRTERLEQLAADIAASGGQAAWQRLDVTDRASVSQFVDAAAQRFGRIDVMVNNAGVMPLSPLAALKTEEWDRMIDVNLRGLLHGVAAALPRFLAQGGGQFVNIASLGAHYVVPTAAVYCATKFAVWAITDGIRREHDNIRATIISPGTVESELADSITDPGTIEAMAAFRAAAIKADAIARAIFYAVSQPADVDVSEIIVRPTASDVI
ncbi:SDR family NAD(P)-dependent oxidoreductase [Pseudoroseomonas wenyumeiae]|uniref:SDR family NAD(P)-dependent oxidoreductase n=1 Tax=Teichococcus wenyumeiae TaxID=2478470 RepID=A0A3A9JDL7_9PROT|nr:SDR family oxidoreductase [Pseudoroseomonas wenyumeiae]RKK02655.1 SDR family oxidoreductase [Pseudoroseomonas wenyumeiae]RMI20217.1 SDR family NAD(P)-dependent oxidoreductase [Pseudoroseomonas wenyumeiae]